MFTRRDPLNVSLLAFLLLLVVNTMTPLAYSAHSSNPANRIVNTVNESDLVQLTGNTHPLAIAKFDQGAVADTLQIEHMFVVLRRGPEQEQPLQQRTAELQNPHSVNYHRWLTAATGRKVTKEEMKGINLQPDRFHGEWKYVIRPH